MPSPVVGFAVLSVLYVIYQYLYKTDIPKIKGLPEIPGWPLFGSLHELGEYHAKVAQKWAKKYGPVFQVRLGNKVWNPDRSRALDLSQIRSQCIHSNRESSLRTPSTQFVISG